METVATPKIKATIRAHAITLDGRQVLIEAKGPGTSLLERRIARYNSLRWNKGLRSWLLS
jgi:hypothetical protein